MALGVRRALTIRALWWRRGLASALLLVSVVTITAAALGPLYARAAGESILQDHLKNAGADAGLHVYGQIDIGSAGAYQKISEQVPRPGALRGYDNRIDGLFITGAAVAASDAHQTVRTRIAWRDGMCAHLVIVAGRCPTGSGEAMAAERTVTAGHYGFGIGSTVQVRQASDRPGTPAEPPLRIVGTYRPRNVADAYWFSHPYFAPAPGRGDGPDLIDALFTSRPSFLAMPSPTPVEADFDYPLTPSSIRLSGAAQERSTIAAFVNDHRSDILADTNLSSILDSARAERSVADVSTLLVILQLAVLAWLVLFQIVSDAIEARGNDIAIAKLRGFSPLATTRFGLGEPVALLVCALPIGLLCAVGITHLFARTVLVPGVPVAMPGQALLTAAVAFAGGIVAAALASYRTLTRPVLDQWRRTDRTPASGAVALVLDAVLAGAAIGCLTWLTRFHGRASAHDTVPLLGPGLLVTAVGLLGVRLLPLFCRMLAARTRASRRLGLFVASRQVARRPVGLRLASLLAIAVGLATFAVSGEAVASSNRTARAQAELGASAIAQVQFDDGVDPIAATAKADPAGRWAAAAATWLPDGGESVTGTVLGVDARRLQSVGFAAAGGPSTAEIAHLVGRSAVPPITITAPRVRVTVTADALSGNQPPTVQLNLSTPTTQFYDVDVAPVRAGTHSYTAQVDCAAGCSLHGLSWRRPILADTALGGTLTLSGIDVGDGTRWTALNLGLGTAASWRAAVPAGHASDTVQISGSGVTDRFTDDEGGFGGITYADTPSPLPAVATPKAVANAGTPVQQMTDANAISADYTVARYVPVLPVVGDNGLLLDLHGLRTELPGFATEASWQVWLGPHAPADALPRLEAVGLHVQNVQRVAARIGQLQRQGPALALLLLLVCAIAGTVLAVGGTVISVSASSRRRSYELAALATVGFPRTSLRRAGLFELLLVLGAAGLLGVPAAIVAAHLAMPRIPEFADPTPIALNYAPPWLATTVFVGCFVLLLVATSIAAARAVVRRAVPSRLRESE